MATVKLDGLIKKILAVGSRNATSGCSPLLMLDGHNYTVILILFTFLRKIQESYFVFLPPITYVAQTMDVSLFAAVIRHGRKHAMIISRKG